jgi:hypothetical protein
MIKPEQIPDEVVEALLDTSNVAQPWTHAIAAAINAWPGVIENGHWLLFPHTKLPLTENPND